MYTVKRYLSNVTLSLKMPKLLLTNKSSHNISTRRGKKYYNPPSLLSFIFTIIFYLIIFDVLQTISHHFVTTYSHILPPVFLDETSRHFISRNISFNFLSCLYCSILGWKNYPSVRDILTRTTTSKLAVNRLLHFLPASYPVTLFFLSYQLRNMYNDFFYNPSVIYIFHHFLCISCTSLCLIYTVAQSYCIITCGISETSTVILILNECLDIFERMGSENPLPKSHIILKANFVFFFVWIRIVLLTRGFVCYVRDFRLVWKKTLLKMKIVLGFIGLLMGCVMVLQYSWLWIITVTVTAQLKKWLNI